MYTDSRKLEVTCYLLLTHIYNVIKGIVSQAFDRPVGRRYFEDVAAVPWNRRIENGRYSTRVHGQTHVGVFFQDSDILKAFCLL